MSHSVSVAEMVSVLFGLVGGAWIVSSSRRDQAVYYLGLSLLVINTTALAALAVLKVVTS